MPDGECELNVHSSAILCLQRSFKVGKAVVCRTGTPHPARLRHILDVPGSAKTCGTLQEAVEKSGHSSTALPKDGLHQCSLSMDGGPPELSICCRGLCFSDALVMTD